MPYAAPGCSRFLGRSEHTCNTRAQQEDCSGIRTHNLSSLACLKVQALPLSYLLLIYNVDSVDGVGSVDSVDSVDGVGSVDSVGGVGGECGECGECGDW